MKPMKEPKGDLKTPKTVTKTFRDLIILDNFVGSLYDKKITSINSKFGYAYTKFYKLNYKPHFDKFKEEMEDLSIKFALEDKETKAILSNPNKDEQRRYLYNKEDLIKLIKEERKLKENYEEMEIKITPYFISKEFIPKDLLPEELEMLKGCLLE